MRRPTWRRTHRAKRRRISDRKARQARRALVAEINARLLDC